VGIGDEILATRHVEELWRKEHKLVRILDNEGNPRGHEVWHGNPHIPPVHSHGSHGKDYINLPWNSSCRPYINYRTSTQERFQFLDTEYSVKPGRLYLTEQEQVEADKLGDYVLIEPTVKGPLQVNKAWPMGHWKDLVDMVDFPMVQLLHSPHQQKLWSRISDDRVKHISIRSIREWLIYVSAATAIVTTEGGLHHAAAAFGIPSVVLFSGFISERIMGYKIPYHTNLLARSSHTGYQDEAGSSIWCYRSCGLRKSCPMCQDAMKNLLPVSVYEALMNLPLKEAPRYED